VINVIELFHFSFLGFDQTKRKRSRLLPVLVNRPWSHLQGNLERSMLVNINSLIKKRGTIINPMQGVCQGNCFTSDVGPIVF
jgi:hypothetical protein